MLKVLSFAGLFLMSVQNTVTAGVIFHIETTFPERTERPSRSDSMMIEGEKLKMTVNDTQHAQAIVIYRGDREEILLINTGDRSWRAMDKSTMIRLGQQINPAMKQMQKQMESALKNMPPERRAIMEKMIAGHGLDPGMMGKTVDLQVRDTGKTETINGYPCMQYETWRDEEKMAEHCVTDWRRVPGGQEVRGVFQDMAAFSREIWKGAFQQGGKGPAAFFESMSKMEGYPVLTRIYSDGKLVTESRLTDVEKTEVPAHEFEPPKGYVKKDFLPKNPSAHVPTPP